MYLYSHMKKYILLKYKMCSEKEITNDKGSDLYILFFCSNASNFLVFGYDWYFMVRLIQFYFENFETNESASCDYVFFILI